MDQEGAITMMKNIGLQMMREPSRGMQYASGVPAADKKEFWANSPGNVFRLLLRTA